MTWQVLITVFTFGGVGAVVRAMIIMILEQSAKIFPLSILMVNIMASFLGSFIISMAIPENFATVLMVGLIGGMGTLASINSNILDFFFDRAWRRMGLYILLTTVLGMLAALGGQAFGNMFHDAIVEKSQYQMQALEAMTQELQVENLHLDHEQDFKTELNEEAVNSQESEEAVSEDNANSQDNVENQSTTP